MPGHIFGRLGLTKGWSSFTDMLLLTLESPLIRCWMEYSPPKINTTCCFQYSFLSRRWRKDRRVEEERHHDEGGHVDGDGGRHGGHRGHVGGGGEEQKQGCPYRHSPPSENDTWPKNLTLVYPYQTQFENVSKRMGYLTKLNESYYSSCWFCATSDGACCSCHFGQPVKTHLFTPYRMRRGT